MLDLDAPDAVGRVEGGDQPSALHCLSLSAGVELLRQRRVISNAHTQDTGAPGTHQVGRRGRCSLLGAVGAGGWWLCVVYCIYIVLRAG
jgi:hypothetical protein